MFFMLSFYFNGVLLICKDGNKDFTKNSCIQNDHKDHKDHKDHTFD